MHVVKVPMTLDCGTLTSTARSYAVSHGYCKASGNGAVTPNDTVGGNCGTSEIEIFDAGGGFGNVVYGFDSSLGLVIYRTLHVNGAGGLGNPSWTDSGAMYSTDYYAANDVFFGAGSAVAELDGTVTLWWGAQCVLAQPSTLGYIS